MLVASSDVGSNIANSSYADNSWGQRAKWCKGKEEWLPSVRLRVPVAPASVLGLGMQCATHQPPGQEYLSCVLT